jgi:hypothetical protein
MKSATAGSWTRFAPWILALSLVIANASVAQVPPTYVDPDGVLQLTCRAPHRATGQLVPVLGVNGYANGFWGFATYNAAGWPTIIFDAAQLSGLPSIVARYVYYHECAHLTVPTTNEFMASCQGLKAMRHRGHITTSQEETLRRVHYSLPSLGPQYGGSGRALWEGTVACAGRR